MNIKSKGTALLIIDMEKAFVEPDSPMCISGAKETVPACIEVVEKARRKGIPVFWIKREYRADGSDVELSRLAKWEESGKPLTVSSTGCSSTEEPEDLEIKQGDYVIIKNRWSGFFQTELDMILRRLSVDTVVIIGTTTPNCVRTTAYDALALDYQTIVIERCCSSDSDEIQRVNMEDMERAGAVIAR